MSLSGRTQFFQLPFLRRLLSFGVLLSLVGCQSGPPFPLAPVTGRVSNRGEPVAGAVVHFYCPGKPRIAMGKTDSNGNFQLTSYLPNDGAYVGDNAATVQKWEVTSMGNLEAFGPRERIAERMRFLGPGRSGRPVQRKPLLPLRYADAKLPVLHFTVKSGATNDFEIVLLD